MDSCINLNNQGMFYIYEPFQDHGAKIIRWWLEISFKRFWAPIFRRNQSLAAVRMNSLFQCHFQNLSGYLNYEKVLQHNPRIDCTKHFQEKWKYNSQTWNLCQKIILNNIDAPGKQDWLPAQPKALEAIERHSLKNL